MCYNYFYVADGGEEMEAETVVRRLLDWYTLHFRALPWRQEPTPYRVWISEIMLQQTRIEAVLPYYERFMSALPDVQALADVPEDKLLKLWEGLGYYSRARNLQRAAKQIVDQYGGQLPADYDRLLALPGIGAYTAGAIASIAYNIPVPAVDGNVMRVLARLTGNETDVLSTAGKKCFTDLAWSLIPEEQPGRFNQALMELGETVCLPKAQPHCDCCPLAGQCAAFREDTAARLPVRGAKKARRIEHRHIAVVRIASQPPAVLLHKRPDTGLLAGLWELPNAPVGMSPLPEDIVPYCTQAGELGNCKHIFSHVEWHMTGDLFTAPSSLVCPEDYAAVSLEALQAHYALPSAFRYYATQLPRLLEKGE